MYGKEHPAHSAPSAQELWRRFESTGSIQQYLRYRQAQRADDEERLHAHHGDGAGREGGEGGRG